MFTGKLGFFCQVFFHRSRIYLDGVHLSVTADLSAVISVGMKVGLGLRTLHIFAPVLDYF